LNGLGDPVGIEEEQVVTQDAMAKPATVKCKHCWYVPPKEKQTNKRAE